MSDPAQGSAWEVGPHGEILRWLRSHAGLRFPSDRRREVELAVARGMDRTGAGTPSAYAAVLRREAAERDELVGSLTVGETYFFREPRQFRFIADEVVPGLARAHPGTLRAWSAGCAAGEEAYSMSILFDRLGLLGRTRVLGTDISRQRLAAAGSAVYRPWSLRGLPQDLLRKYFEERGARFELIPRVRNAVEFAYLNLAEDTYPSIGAGTAGTHLILCRNVLIYLDPNTIPRVASRLLASLADDGWLFLAASDPQLGDYVPCRAVQTGAGVAYRRAEGGKRSHFLPSPVPGTADAVPEPPLEDGPPAADPALPEERSVDVSGGDLVEALREAYEWKEYDRVVRLARAGAPEGGGRPAEAWVVWVRALASSGRTREAARVCTRALEEHPLVAELFYLQSVLLAGSGRYRDAAVAARRALYLDRGLIVAHLGLGRALGRAGDAAAALRAYRSADRLLQRLPPDEPVPGADGETAARLRRYLRVQLRLLGEAA